MKYQSFAVLLLLFSSSFTNAASSNKVITVKEVGLSMNTSRIFVDPNEAITDSNCAANSLLSIALPLPEAYLFYSAALNAMNEGKKMRVIYSTSECVDNGPKVEVFWNLNR